MLVVASDFQFPDYLLHKENRNFPGGPVVKNHLCSAGDTGSIPSRGTNITHASEKLSLSAKTTEPACHNWRVCGLQQRPSAAK